MTKLVAAFATLALAATPVLACPHGGDDAAPRTVEKSKPAEKQAKAKPAPAKAAPKDQAKAKTAPKPKTDKVSKR